MKNHESIISCAGAPDKPRGGVVLPCRHEPANHAQSLKTTAGWQWLVLAVMAAVFSFSTVSFGHAAPLDMVAGAGTGVSASHCPSPPVLSSANVKVTQPTCTNSTGYIQVLNAPFNSVAQLMPNAPKPSGGNPYLFSYLVPGTYRLTLTVNGCTSAPRTIVINPAPAPVLTLANVRVTQPTCTTTTGYIQVLNPPAGATAQLTPNAPRPSRGNAFLFSFLPPGTYSLTLTAANGCTSAVDSHQSGRAGRHQLHLSQCRYRYRPAALDRPDGAQPAHAEPERPSQYQPGQRWQCRI
ncbi:hypothetical protein [Hymenobacter siberiensis]|uniref:hypothetical protein n=1 Tax=Hymenobacter siberiensis TaxID=2848396 RepID=UPI001C1E7B55|nr:hypothetical protein [Hymenobacter siberiensis]